MQATPYPPVEIAPSFLPMRHAPIAPKPLKTRAVCTFLCGRLFFSMAAIGMLPVSVSQTSLLCKRLCCRCCASILHAKCCLSCLRSCPGASLDTSRCAFLRTFLNHLTFHICISLPPPSSAARVASNIRAGMPQPLLLPTLAMNA